MWKNFSKKTFTFKSPPFHVEHEKSEFPAKHVYVINSLPLFTTSFVGLEVRLQPDM